MSVLKIRILAMSAFMAFVGVAAHADTVTLSQNVSGTVPFNGGSGISNILGYSFNGGATTFGLGGNFGDSTGTIGGQTVAFSQLWCIDINDDANPGTTYTATYTNNGTVQNGTPVNNAGQIAWLIENLGPGATTEDQNLALQAAIWQTEYGSMFALSTSDNTADVISDFNADLAALGNNTADVSSLEWISPTNPDGSNAQALAGIAATPEPGTFVLLGSGLLGLAGTVRRRLAASR